MRAIGLILALLFQEPAPERRVLSFKHVHGAGVRTITFSPDFTRFATGGVDPSLRVWDLATGKELLEIAGPSGGAPALAFSADGKRLVSGGGDGTVQVWDAATGKALTALPGHPRGVYTLAVSPDFSRVASADGDGVIRVSDVANTREVCSFQVPVLTEHRTLRTRQPGVYDLAFSPDGKALVSFENSGLVRVWQAETGAPLLCLEGHEGGGHSVAASPDGRSIASGSDDGTVRLWDAATGREFSRLRPSVDGFQSVAFSPDGLWLAAGESMGCTIYVWEVATGFLLRTLKGHEGGIIALGFAPDGRRLCSGGADRTVRVWELAQIPQPAAPEILAERLSGRGRHEAFQAMWGLVELGSRAIPLLAERLRVERSSDDNARALVADLDDDDLVRRDAARSDLQAMGDRAERVLRAYASEGTAEQKARIEPLLKALESPLLPPGEALGRLRAIQAVERIPGPEATDLLRRLADGSSSEREQRLARSALSRRTISR